MCPEGVLNSVKESILLGLKKQKKRVITWKRTKTQKVGKCSKGLRFCIHLKLPWWLFWLLIWIEMSWRKGESLSSAWFVFQMWAVYRCLIGKMVVPFGMVPENHQPHIHLISRGYYWPISPVKGLQQGGLNSCPGPPSQKYQHFSPNISGT